MKELEDRNGFPEVEGHLNGPGFPDGEEIRESGDRVMVLPVNEDSRKITQTLSNETSLKVLELLGKKSLSATDIAEELKIPLTTVKYNLDSLVDSDLIKVKQIKWSRKGRQVKIYEAMEKLIILVPSRNPVDKISIINLLQQYIGVIAAAFFAAAGIEYLSAYLKARKVFQATAPLRLGVMEDGNAPVPAAVIANDTSGGDVGEAGEPGLMDVGIESFSEEEAAPQNEAQSEAPDVAPKEANEAFTGESPEEEPVDEEVMEESLKEEFASEDAPVDDASEDVMDDAPVEDVATEETMEAEYVEEAPVEEPVDEGVMEDASVEEAAEGMDVPDTDSMDGIEGLDGMGGMDDLPPVPPEGITHLGGIHGLYDTLSLHPGVWFLLGCLFVVCLMIVREVYYKKKTK
ncbi:putative transcriptional regulators [Methanosarcina sp. MTP4]|uniref:ArsR/SmtB family transcription factor n=1 Tax=Methanosarcina sp. MTP4 TaxID=1434100 RepID=UPI000615B1B0|nr:winged helix-turn-helix domain-containing protein [Methanosarcina sp. MTP4]AKB26549.1 putative transcriptional regulators [Methanosarcina sp. MTP4]